MGFLIVKGTFFSEGYLDEHQVRAIKLVEKIGKKLIMFHPEIADLYRRGGNFETQEAIAEKYVYCYSAYPGLATAAVCYAIRNLIPEEERKEINRIRNTKRLETTLGGFDSDRFKEHCRNAARRRHELGIPVDADAMILGRGFVPWSKEERKYVINIVYSGNSDYEDISRDLNSRFHKGEEVRNKKSVYDMVRYEARRKNN